MYAEKQETLSIGQAATRALEKAGKKAIVVLVSNLSNRFEVKQIDPANDRISSLKDDEWNRKILEIFKEGRLEDVSEVAREFSRQANADMGFKGVWWLNGLCGKTNAFKGKIFDYQPVWGTGAPLIGLYPTQPVKPIPGWVNDEADLVERINLNVNSPGSGGPAGTSGEVSLAASGVKSPPESSKAATSGAGLSDSSLHKIMASKAPEPVGPYPHARRVGELLFLSGVGPRKPGTKEIPGVTLDPEGNVVAHDIEVQTRSVIENVINILEASGSRIQDVVDVQVFLTDMKKDFQKFNKVYGEYFAAVGPTRTTVEVLSLPTPIAVELKVIARPSH